MINRIEKKYFVFDKNTGAVVHTVTHIYDENVPDEFKNLTEEKVFSYYQNHRKTVDENKLSGKTQSDFHIYNPDSADADVKKGKIHLFKYENNQVTRMTQEQYDAAKVEVTPGGVIGIVN